MTGPMKETKQGTQTGRERVSPWIQEEAMRFRRALSTAAVAGVLVGSTGAEAQTGRAWVDPPADPSPAEKAATPAPSPAAPAEAASKPVPAPATANQPTGSPASETASRPATKRLARTKKRVETAERSTIERRQAGAARSATNRRTAAAARRRDRVILEAGGEPLELMTLRTIEFPDGRRIQVLTRPDPATASRLLGR
jgi:hypothetical protein